MKIEAPQIATDEPKINNVNSIKKNDLKVNFIRHSNATYATYNKMVKSENPSTKFKPNEQIYPDLSHEGIEKAKESAQKFFKELNPENTELFFVSSNEARAIETAGIYLSEAFKNKFDVIKPENSRSKISDEHLEGYVRIINQLSNNYDQAIVSSLLYPEDTRRNINFENIKPAERILFERIKEIIDQDNKGSFSSNYLAYGSKIKEIIPEFETAEDLYDNNFKNLIRLFRFAENKNSNTNKKIQILAFGHENQVLIALNKYFEENNINNCEVLNVESREGKEIVGTFRGKTTKIY